MMLWQQAAEKSSTHAQHYAKKMPPPVVTSWRRSSKQLRPSCCQHNACLVRVALMRLPRILNRVAGAEADALSSAHASHVCPVSAEVAILWAGVGDRLLHAVRSSIFSLQQRYIKIQHSTSTAPEYVIVPELAGEDISLLGAQPQRQCIGLCRARSVGEVLAHEVANRACSVRPDEVALTRSR